MKKLMTRIKEKAPLAKKQFEEFAEERLKSPIYQQIKTRADQDSSKAKKPKSREANQAFQQESPNQNTRMNEYKVRPNSSQFIGPKWWSTLQEKIDHSSIHDFNLKVAEKLKDKYSKTKETLKKANPKKAINLQSLEVNFEEPMKKIKKYKSKIRNMGKEFHNLELSHLVKILSLPLPKRRIKWILAVAFSSFFIYGVGRSFPAAYLNYKLEMERLDIEKKRIGLQELQIKGSTPPTETEEM